MTKKGWRLLELLRKTGKEVAIALGPVVLTVLILHFTVLPLDAETFWRYIFGSLMVYVGMVLFLVGADLSLLPLGERVGSALPVKGIVLLLTFAFVLGAFVTIADPDAQVLGSYVDTASDGAISYWVLLISVAVGMGLLAAISMIRVVFQIPLSVVLGISYLLVFILSLFVSPEYISIAFDAGGVATGPLFAPFIIAFGVGVASVLRTKDRMASSFGILATAALGPIIGVLILGLIYG